MVENSLQILAALAGLAQENMNRTAGWRFLDMGRRIERGVNTCRFTRVLAHAEATADDLDLLLDLADSQITYRARYLVGLALRPVMDMVMLDPFNTRSLAFQVVTLQEHLTSLPSLVDDGMLEALWRILRDAGDRGGDRRCRPYRRRGRMWEFESTLPDLSSAVAARYFLNGANAVPTVKLAALA